MLSGPIPIPVWMEHAACRGVGDVMYPDEHDRPAILVAKRICYSCPVSADCHDYALTRNETEGVWAGLTGQQRKNLRRALYREAVRECAAECAA